MHQIAFNPGNNIDEPKHLCEDITLPVPPIIETVLRPHQNKMLHSIALGMLFICQYDGGTSYATLQIFVTWD